MRKNLKIVAHNGMSEKDKKFISQSDVEAYEARRKVWKMLWRLC